MVSGLFDDNEIEVVKMELAKITEGTIPFLQIDGEKVGGSKCLECDVFISAINYLDYEKFVDVIKGLQPLIGRSTWEDLQVFIKNQNDDTWHVHLASELTAECF